MTAVIPPVEEAPIVQSATLAIDDGAGISTIEFPNVSGGIDIHKETDESGKTTAVVLRFPVESFDDDGSVMRARVMKNTSIEYHQ